MKERQRFTLAWIGLIFLGALLAQFYRSAVSDQYRIEEVSYQVNVNSADPSELRLLPGIGTALAQRILEARLQGGPFRDGEDLCRRVPGIGPTLWQQAQKWATFQP